METPNCFGCGKDYLQLMCSVDDIVTIKVNGKEEKCCPYCVEEVVEVYSNVDLG